LASAYQSVDAEVLRESAENDGAVIMGRRTFDVSIDDWGDEPPINRPCFVVTGRPEPSFTQGRTTFTFVRTLDEASRMALAAAGGRDVCVMGGARTIRSMLEAGLLDRLHLHVVPVLLGDGTRLFDNTRDDGFQLVLERVRRGAAAIHQLYRIQRG
jgi:dihydrofolate reductase